MVPATPPTKEKSSLHTGNYFHPASSLLCDSSLPSFLNSCTYGPVSLRLPRSASCRVQGQNRRLEVFSAAAASASGNGAPPKSFDYDLIIIRAGVGGHGAAWHAVEKVTFIEALDQLMLGFDPAISKLTQRILINPRKIDYHTGVFASKITPAKDGKPVIIELIDARTKELKDKLEVDAALITTGRAPFTNGLSLENEIEQPSGLTQHLEVR